MVTAASMAGKVTAIMIEAVTTTEEHLSKMATNPQYGFVNTAAFITS
jgi:hypothetical protein